VFAQLHGGLGGPDGLALDEEGCLYVAHTGFGSVWQLSRVAEPLARIRSCAGISTTSLAFGGQENKGVFITESETGSMLHAAAPVRGLRMYSHTDPA
jgi:gluconolactonase